LSKALKALFVLLGPISSTTTKTFRSDIFLLYKLQSVVTKIPSVMSAFGKTEAWKQLASSFRKNFSFPTNANINWFPGHMTKGLKMMERTLLETDLVS